MSGQTTSFFILREGLQDVLVTQKVLVVLKVFVPQTTSICKDKKPKMKSQHLWWLSKKLHFKCLINSEIYEDIWTKNGNPQVNTSSRTRVAALLDALTPVWDASCWVSWVDDVALIACRAVKRLISILSCTACLSWWETKQTKTLFAQLNHKKWGSCCGKCKNLLFLWICLFLSSFSAFPTVNASVDFAKIFRLKKWICSVFKSNEIWVYTNISGERHGMHIYLCICSFLCFSFHNSEPN